MADYTYKEVEDALIASGFEEQKNNAGSHQMYVNKKTGFMQTIPQHGKSLATGTAESILDYAVLSAILSEINIYHKKYKLSDIVKSYILKKHKAIKLNKINLIPADVRKQLKIETEEQSIEYFKAKAKEVRKNPSKQNDSNQNTQNKTNKSKQKKNNENGELIDPKSFE